MPSFDPLQARLGEQLHAPTPAPYTSCDSCQLVSYRCLRKGKCLATHFFLLQRDVSFGVACCRDSLLNAFFLRRYTQRTEYDVNKSYNQEQRTGRCSSEVEQTASRAIYVRGRHRVTSTHVQWSPNLIKRTAAFSTVAVALTSASKASVKSSSPSFSIDTAFHRS